MDRSLIFDVGMNDGKDTAFYLAKGFRVVAVEADPKLAADAKHRFAPYLAEGRLTIVDKAIAERDGPITFYSCEAPTIWSTTDKTFAARNMALGATIKEITVPAIRFAHLLDEHGTPYYLKIDIEGADMHCLRGLLGRSDRPSFISIESSKATMKDVHEEFELFRLLGYYGFKVVPQHKVWRQKLPKSAREGAYVEHEFVTGCSGAFGHELPGRWLSAEEAIGHYRWIHRLYRLTGDRGALTSIPIVRRSLNKGRLQPRSPIGRLVRPIKAMLRPLVTGWYDTHAMYGGPHANSGNNILDSVDD
jgi:FkbM family methyltransferase